MEKSCWYKAVVGIDPDPAECKRLHTDGCDGCSFFLPDPPEWDEIPDCYVEWLGYIYE